MQSIVNKQSSLPANLSIRPFFPGRGGGLWAKVENSMSCLLNVNIKTDSPGDLDFKRRDRVATFSALGGDLSDTILQT